MPAGPIGYLVPEFPGQTHAFFWREVAAIEEAGVSVRIYSTKRPGREACPHVFAPEAIERTTYLFPPLAIPALSRMLLHPIRTLRAFSYIGRLTESPIRERLKLMGLIASAATLVEDAQKSGVRHLHIHSCANAAYLGALSQILGDLTFSLTLHGDLSVYGANHAAKMRRASFVSAVTRPLALQIKAVSPATEAPVIWMGVDCERFRPQERTMNPVFTVASVARLNRAKGHRFFLQAMALLRDEGLDLRYLIAGNGPEEPAIQAEIERLALQDQVQMLGAVDEARVLDLLGKVDALALTSTGKGEAAPVAVMEAMSCGLPVICSIIGGTPDMITDGVDGFLVNQEDVAAIAERLKRLIIDRSLAVQLGQAARVTALSHFDHRTNAAKLVKQITVSEQ